MTEETRQPGGRTADDAAETARMEARPPTEETAPEPGRAENEPADGGSAAATEPDAAVAQQALPPEAPATEAPHEAPHEAIVEEEAAQVLGEMVQDTVFEAQTSRAGFNRVVGGLIQNAQELLSYGVERGLDLRPEHISVVTEAIHYHGTDGWTLELEQRFLNAYREMSAAFDGVSTETIAASKRFGFVYTLIIALLGAVFLYFLISKQNELVRLQDSSSSFDRLYQEMTGTEAQIETLLRTETGLTTQIAAIGAQMKQPGTPVEQLGALDSQRTELSRERDKTLAELKVKELLRTRLEHQVNAQFQVISELLPQAENDTQPERPSSWLSVDEAELAVWERQMEAWRSRQAARQPAERFYVLQQAKSQIVFYNAYLLPALYGLLGTAAFVLRAFSRELRRLTLQSENILNYMIRLPLGALSGVAVGLILTEETVPEGLAGITPIALAFIAGYSVEILFAAMDRIVMAFGGEQQRRPGAGR
ncbi:MAG: hypothetical protein AAF074_00755 [Pseudomonadota bacterium]